MKKAMIFLNSPCLKQNSGLYSMQTEKNKDAFLIAVDGALDFFVEIKKKPDLIIGDMDSVDRRILKLFEEVRKRFYPTSKDATDGELALDYCLENGYDDVIMMGGVDTELETDHTLGNIFMMYKAIEFEKENKKKINIRMDDIYQQVYLVEDSTLYLEKNYRDVVSVIPLSPEVELYYEGLQYPPLPEKRFRAYFGKTLTLRNRIVDSKALIEVKGLAVVVVRNNPDPSYELC